MEPTSAGPAYLAVIKAEKTKLWHEKMLNPSVFSWSPRTYSKLFPDQEAAVKQALKCRTLESAKVALEPTTFYLLSLYFTDKQWLNLFLATEKPKIQMGPQRKAYRLYGTLYIREVKKDWHRIELCTIGIDAWADHALEKCVWYPKGLCAECKVNDVKVYKPKKQCKKDWYCSQCWYKYICYLWQAEGQHDGQAQGN